VEIEVSGVAQVVIMIRITHAYDVTVHSAMHRPVNCMPCNETQQ
jgi:hypothetical protein